MRVAKISGLSRDLALALKAERLRIEAPVPGESYVGVEVPNTVHTIVKLRPILESEEFLALHSPLAFPLGKDVSGAPMVADLAVMPHLLIAGQTTRASRFVSCDHRLPGDEQQTDDLRLVMIDRNRWN